MKKDPLVYLEDVVKSSNSIAKYINNKSKEEFVENVWLTITEVLPEFKEKIEELLVKLSI